MRDPHFREMKSSLRILLWYEHGAGLHYKGAGTNAYRLYSTKEKASCEVTLACACPEQESYPVFREIVQIHRPQGPRVFDQLLFLVKAKKWLRANAHRFDVFHGLDIYESTLLPALWAERLGLPAFVKPAAHGTGLRSVRGIKRLFGLPARRRRILREVSGVIAISSAIDRELREHGVERIHRIPNGVDTDRFRPTGPGEKTAIRKELGWPEEAFILLFVGGIDSRKRPRWILEGAGPLLAGYPRLRIVLVGPEREKGHLAFLEDMVSSHGWEDRVAFVPHTPDVERYYRAADLYCLPSSREGMPNSVLEAMASGLPCLVTRISGSEDLIEDGVSGWFVGDPAGIRERVKGYLGDAEAVRRHGECARNRIENRFSTARVLEDHLRIFRRASGKPCPENASAAEFESSIR